MELAPASYLFLVLPADVGFAEGGLLPVLIPVSVVKYSFILVMFISLTTLRKRTVAEALKLN